MKYVVSLLLLITGLPSCSQDASVSKDAAVSPLVYGYVEQMPQMPDGGDISAIATEFLKNINIPASADNDSARYSGIQVTFIVGPDGLARDAEVSRSSNNAAIDSSLIAAANHLPKLRPGYHNGQAVPVRLTIPISCIKPQF